MGALWTGIIVIVSIVVSGAGGYFGRRYLDKIKLASAEEVSRKIIKEAQDEAQLIKKEVILEARDELHKEKGEFEKEIRNRRGELGKIESRLSQKEESLDQKLENIERKAKEVKSYEAKLVEKEQEITSLRQEQINKLEKISELSSAEAKKMLMISIESEVRHEANKMIKQIEDEANEMAEKKSKEVLVQAIQRCASEQVAETTVSVVNLPSDEMKGRIIGREGRNIRALETLTGIDLIIDDTPEAVILSGFDPVKRAIAKLALERLIVDGRIHPARIEEVVAKVKEEIEESMKEKGEQATFDLGIHGIAHEAVYLLGRLKYRTSFGQNVLQHSKEVATIASVIAGEIGANVTLVKRAGLLHDLGKSIDADVEGSHASIGADLARKFGESKEIIHAIAAHHDEEKPQTLEAFIIQAADAVSAARPGARKENMEAYVKRLKKLESVAEEFKGVEKAYAIQAGREVRVAVLSEEVDDVGMATLARNIAKQIESQLEYPGQIKITVIRETRAVEYAK